MINHLSSARLHQIAREERARRKAAWERAGKAGTEKALYDDALWSNVEQMAGVAAGDPVCLSRKPRWWSEPQRIIMARNIFATANKADQSLDLSIEANVQKVCGLFALYRWVRPIGWSPFIQEAAA